MPQKAYLRVLSKQFGYSPAALLKADTALTTAELTDELAVETAAGAPRV